MPHPLGCSPGVVHATPTRLQPVRGTGRTHGAAAGAWYTPHPRGCSRCVVHAAPTGLQPERGPFGLIVTRAQLPFRHLKEVAEFAQSAQPPAAPIRLELQPQDGARRELCFAIPGGEGQVCVGRGAGCRPALGRGAAAPTLPPPTLRAPFAPSPHFPSSTKAVTTSFRCLSLPWPHTASPSPSLGWAEGPAPRQSLFIGDQQGHPQQQDLTLDPMLQLTGPERTRTPLAQTLRPQGGWGPRFSGFCACGWTCQNAAGEAIPVTSVV
ncbi:unnamed protein product [Natator depressus]